MIRRGDLPEPPPKGWDQLGIHPAWTLKELHPLEVRKACAAAGTSAGAKNYTSTHATACADVNGKVIYIPDGMDPQKRAAMIAHEGAHAWGLSHGDTGKGWFVRGSNTPAQPISEAQARMMLAMAKSQNVFAQQQPPVAPAQAGAGNIFRGR